MLGRYTPGRRANNRSFGVMSPVAMRCGTGYLLTRWRRRRRLCRRCRRRRRRRCLSCGGRTLPLLFCSATLCSATLFFVARRPRGKGCLSPRAGLEVLSVAHWDGVSRSPRKGITKLEETPTAERATRVFIYSPGRYRQTGSAVPRLDNSAPPGRSTLGVAQTSVWEHFHCQCLSKNACARDPWSKLATESAVGRQNPLLAPHHRPYPGRLRSITSAPGRGQVIPATVTKYSIAVLLCSSVHGANDFTD